MRRVLVLAALLGCHDKPPAETPDAPPVPPDTAEPDAPVPVAPLLRNPVDTADPELALAALKVLGANVPGATTTSCNKCHALTRQQLRFWRGLADTSISTCLTDLAVGSPTSAKSMLDCLRAMPAVGTSKFQARKLGIYAAATHLPWFQFTVEQGYGGDAAAVQAQLQTEAGMPRAGGGAVAWTQEQFDIVAEWYARGLPKLEETLPQDPGPQTCEAAVSADVGAHVVAMKTEGWRARNKTNLMAMFGCGAQTDPKLCLSTTPLGSAQPYGTGWDVAGAGKLRVLADVSYQSSFWTRSSPDGRFIGHGANSVAGSIILDLARSALEIGIDAAFDPAWFPDNSGFMFQGGGNNACGQSVLTSNPTHVTMNEPACSSLGTVGLYQHVGAVAGGDHFAIDSRFVSDDGGHFLTVGDPSAFFDSSASMDFIPLIFDGTKFLTKSPITVAAPFEGDAVLSPSARLAMTRVAGPSSEQLGFVLRKVAATPVGNSYSIGTPEIARYCFSGGKPAFSYDERWIAFHHYIGPEDAADLGFSGPGDPGFAPYLSLGGANLYVMDLSTGIPQRITNMHPGQYALYPHFRSDGWLYGEVRDGQAGREYTIASEAVRVLE